MSPIVIGSPRARGVVKQGLVASLWPGKGILTRSKDMAISKGFWPDLNDSSQIWPRTCVCPIQGHRCCLVYATLFSASPLPESR